MRWIESLDPMAALAAFASAMALLSGLYILGLICPFGCDDGIDE